MHGEINLYQVFYWSLLILYMHNVDTLNICMKKCNAKHFELSHLFNTLLLNKGFVNAQIVHAWGNQLVPGLLLKPSDTLHAQCWHIEHLHEDVWCHKVLFWQNYIVLAHLSHFANWSQISCGASLGWGKESMFKRSGSHDQDGRHAHIWLKP